MSSSAPKTVGSDDAKREAASYLQEIEQIASAAEHTPRPEPRRRSYLPLLMTLLPVLIALSAWNVARALNRPLLFTPAEERAEALLTVLEAAEAIDGYRDSTGALPASLDATDADGEDVAYSVSGDAYALATATPRVEYRSATGPESLERELATLMEAGNQ